MKQMETRRRHRVHLLIIAQQKVALQIFRSLIISPRYIGMSQ